MEIKNLIPGKALRAISKYRYVIIVIFLGIILLALPGGKEKDTENKKEPNESFSVTDFEQRLEKTLLACNGVGRVKVMLSVKSGTERVYAHEERTRSDKNETESEMHELDTKPSVISAEGGEEPLIIKQVYPKFQGALIICDGAESPSVRADITEAVASVTGLRADKISIIKMKK